MNNRRIIAARRGGRSVVIEDAPQRSHALRAVPGFEASVVWRTAAQPSLAWDRRTETHPASVLPEVGGTTLFVVTFPPDSVMADSRFDPDAAAAEYAQILPGLAELFERDHPGMHTTPTIDYDVVLDGRIMVEFDDGAMVDLNPGDVLIQHGTRHAWRNRGERPATMLFVLIGASDSSRNDA